MYESKNVLGEKLQVCSSRPLTGFYRDGCCNTGREDVGLHTVCTQVTEEFLAFSKAKGNDLSTPRPELGFDGLKPVTAGACVPCVGKKLTMLAQRQSFS